MSRANKAGKENPQAPPQYQVLDDNDISPPPQGVSVALFEMDSLAHALNEGLYDNLILKGLNKGLTFAQIAKRINEERRL